MSDWEKNEEIQIFREYLRIPSVHPNINYEPCVDFLREQSEKLGLQFRVDHPVRKDRPIVVLTWIGTQPELKSIVLNSHMDVVPVYEEYWTHKPFDADIDKDGKIYARGSQDMKCVGMQYLGAIRYFIRNNIKFKRTIHVTFSPEEEVGGVDGMLDYVHTKEFLSLNVGFALDEGIASPTEVFSVYYAERAMWHIKFTLQGTAGHGSILHEDTVGDKLRYLLDKFLDLRKHSVQMLENNPELTLGDVTSVNITQVHGGNAINVVPPIMNLTVDCRLALEVNHEDFENMFKTWCNEAGGNITYTFVQKGPYIKPTAIDDSNIFWTAFKTSVDDLQLKIKTMVFPGGTDARQIRFVGIPAIGFSPMNNTPILLHDHDEYLQADVYLKGIEIYKEIISNIANVI